jgi:hypothetical protein
MNRMKGLFASCRQAITHQIAPNDVNIIAGE